MLYERLSLPWMLLQYPADLLQTPIRTAVACLYDDIKTLWGIWKGNIQNCEDLPQEEKVKVYAEGELEQHRGSRTPWMKLDYDSWDTWIEGTADDFFQQPREKCPRMLYWDNCTWKELAILNVECSVDGIPWVLNDEN